MFISCALHTYTFIKSDFLKYMSLISSIPVSLKNKLNTENNNNNNTNNNNTNNNKNDMFKKTFSHKRDE